MLSAPRIGFALLALLAGALPAVAQPQFRVRGIAVAPRGARVTVEVVDPRSWDPASRVAADAAGRYEVPVPAIPGVALRLRAAGAATRLVSLPQPEVEGTLVVPRRALVGGRRLAFRIVDPPAGALIEVHRVAETGVLAPGTRVLSAQPGKDGEVLLEGLPNQAVWIWITAEDREPWIALVDGAGRPLAGSMIELRSRGAPIRLRGDFGARARFVGHWVLPAQVPGANRFLRRQALPSPLRREGEDWVLDGPAHAMAEGVVLGEGAAVWAPLRAVAGGSAIPVALEAIERWGEIEIFAAPRGDTPSWRGWLSGPVERALESAAAEGVPAPPIPMDFVYAADGLIRHHRVVGPPTGKGLLSIEGDGAPVVVEARIVTSLRGGTLPKGDPWIAWRRHAQAPLYLLAPGSLDSEVAIEVRVPPGRGELLAWGITQRAGVPVPLVGAPGDRLRLSLGHVAAGDVAGSWNSGDRGPDPRRLPLRLALAPQGVLDPLAIHECLVGDDGGFSLTGLAPGVSWVLHCEAAGYEPFEDGPVTVGSATRWNLKADALLPLRRVELRGPAGAVLGVETWPASAEGPQVCILDPRGRAAIEVRSGYHLEVHCGWRPVVRIGAEEGRADLGGHGEEEVRDGIVVAARGDTVQSPVLLLAEPAFAPTGGVLPHAAVAHVRGEWSLRLPAAARFLVTTMGETQPRCRLGPFEARHPQRLRLALPGSARFQARLEGEQSFALPLVRVVAYPASDVLAPRAEPPPIEGWTDAQGRVRLPDLPLGVNRILMGEGQRGLRHLLDNPEFLDLGNRVLPVVDEHPLTRPRRPGDRWYAGDGRGILDALELRTLFGESLHVVTPRGRGSDAETEPPVATGQLSPALPSPEREIERTFAITVGGAPVLGARLELIPLLGDEVDPARSTVETIVSGVEVTVPHLYPGSYLVLIHEGVRTQVGFVVLAEEAVAFQRIEVPTARMEIRCVLGSDFQPQGPAAAASGVTVVVERVRFRDGRRVPPAVARAALVTRAHIGASESVELDRIPRGEALRLRCWREVEGDVAIVDVGPIEDESVSYSLRLDPGVRIRGAVRSSGRHAAVGARMRLLDMDGRDLWGLVRANGEGSFDGPPVPRNPFLRLEARSPSITPWGRDLRTEGAGLIEVEVNGSVIRESLVKIEDREGRPVRGAFLVPVVPDPVQGLPATQALPSADAATGLAGGGRLVSDALGMIRLEAYPAGISSWEVHAPGFAPAALEIRGLWPKRRVILQRTAPR